jgi:hypothetical protein
MSFTTRRTAKPRKIAAAEESEDDAPSPVVRKPTPSAATKKKPGSTRLSFGIDPTDADASEPTAAFVPKKSALSRKAMERNAAKKSLGLGLERLSVTAQERVEYSKEYLEELRRGQMVTPATEQEEDAVMVDLNGDEMADVDMAEATALVPQPTSQTQIMDEGMVRVMKARRKERAAAAKAGADDFISLNDDDDRGEIMLRPKKKKESRLARMEDFNDDEEIANYVDDAEPVLLTKSKSARREQERRRKQEIRETIAEAEGADDEGAESDVSKDSLVEEWERDQIRKGAFQSKEGAPRGLEAELETLARNPPTAMPLPDMADVVNRLEATLKAMEIRKAQTERQIEALVAEKREIREREGMVQTRIKEAAEQYEKLRKEAGIGAAGAGGVAPVDRGLENFGSTPITAAVEE